MIPGNEPDANDRRSENATMEPPGEMDLADALEPAKDTISEIKEIKFSESNTATL